MTDPRKLEDRVVAALAGEQLLQPAMRWPREIFLAGAGAAAGALAVIAIDAGQLLAPSSSPIPTHMLALYTTPTYVPEQAGSGERAAEYGEWASRHGRGKAVVTGGEELGSFQAVIGSPSMDDAVLAGYFLIKADSSAEAVRLARTNPHLRYGGTVIVHDLRR